MNSINCFIFFRKFQLMSSTSDNNFLLSNQDTNQFFVWAKIEPQISYSTVKNFTN